MKKIPIRQLRSDQFELTAAERFIIRRVEDIVGDADMVHDLHRHDYFFILAIKKGKGTHEIDFIDYTVSDHSVFFIRPGQVHQLVLKAGCTGYLLEFNPAFYHPKDKASTQRLKKAIAKNYCPLETARFNRLQQVLATIFDEFTAKEDGFQDIIKSNLDIFFIEFSRQSRNQSPAPVANTYVQERYEELLELLNKHIATHKQVAQYTGMMNLSAYQLNEITKAAVGKTASDLINEQVVLEAKRNLLATPNQVKEIADLLGYEDVSYFIRFFKKHTGFSPEAFRNNFR